MERDHTHTGSWAAIRSIAQPLLIACARSLLVFCRKLIYRLMWRFMSYCYRCARACHRLAHRGHSHMSRFYDRLARRSSGAFGTSIGASIPRGTPHPYLHYVNKNRQRVPVFKKSKSTNELIRMPQKPLYISEGQSAFDLYLK